MPRIIGTINNEGFPSVITEDDDLRVHFTADADIDADGANGQNGKPAAYKSDNSGTEHLANGGMAIQGGKVVCVTSGARSIVILDTDNEPKVFPGGVIASMTWYRYPGKAASDPTAYVDAETVPYVVVPPLIVQQTAGIVRGCKARVTFNGKSVDCVVADRGPKTKIGEISIAAARAVGINPNPRYGGRDIHDVFYELWPGKPAQGFVLQSSSQPAASPTGDVAAPAVKENAAMTIKNGDVFVELAETVGQGVPARRLWEFKVARPNGDPRYWAIVDFNQPSKNKRLYVFDTKDRAVKQYYVAHGSGSDPGHDGVAESFSDAPGSNQSSLGIYRFAETYEGNHGRSLKLDGLEATNSNVRDRSIVMHKADYVSEAIINAQGKPGRSQGCFAVENAVCDTLIDQLSGGSYMIAWKTGVE